MKSLKRVQTVQHKDDWTMYNMRNELCVMSGRAIRKRSSMMG